MQSENRFFADFARVAAGAIGVVTGLRGEVEERLRAELERAVAQLGVVSRDEFEAVKEMAANARAAEAALQKRVAQLEAEIARLGAKPRRAPQGGTKGATKSRTDE